jgi:hypothetical protein
MFPDSGSLVVINYLPLIDFQKVRLCSYGFMNSVRQDGKSEGFFVLQQRLCSGLQSPTNWTVDGLEYFVELMHYSLVLSGSHFWSAA